MNIRQKSYEGCYAPGITSRELRALADLLDYEKLPTDPFTILSLELLGCVVDLESGEIANEAGTKVGHVSDLTPLNVPSDMPPMLTLLDILKHPRTTLIVDGMTLWWDEHLGQYKTSSVDAVEPSLHRTCLAALNAMFAQEVNGDS